jgi:hypothetical protein
MFDNATVTVEAADAVKITSARKERDIQPALKFNF